MCSQSWVRGRGRGRGSGRANFRSTLCVGREWFAGRGYLLGLRVRVGMGLRLD